MLPCPIWPLAQHAGFGQNCSDGSIGPVVVVCIHTPCREPPTFSSFSPSFTSSCGYTILDEATANIDTFTELLVQQALKRLLHGRTALVIAHRLSTIKGADSIVVLQAGRIVEQGTHAELLERKGVYATLYAMGFRHTSKERVDI